MAAGRRHICRVGPARSADAANGRQALLIGVKAAIGGVVRETAVIGAPWTIGMSRRGECRCRDEGAGKAERFIVFPFATLSIGQRVIVN